MQQEEDAARKLYSEFVESFGDEPEQKAPQRSFTRGGTIQPGSSGSSAGKPSCSRPSSLSDCPVKQPMQSHLLTSCRDSLCPQAFSGLPGYCRCVFHLAGSGHKKIGKYVPSFLPPNLAAAINAQTNPHTGAAAAAAAISSRLGGVSRLSGRPVLLQQPANISDSPACRLLNV